MLELANVRWYIGLAILLVDLTALAFIWRSPGHSRKAKIVWTIIVALLPVLGALAWFPLGHERRRH
jgi:hypothetical protein